MLFEGMSKVNALIQSFFRLFDSSERREIIRRRIDDAMEQARNASCRNGEMPRH